MSDRINILNKQGMLTDKDRKQALAHGCEYFVFNSCVDLSQGVDVRPYGSSVNYSIDNYSRDLASFIVWWTHFVLRDLNGFPGFHNIKFNLIGFNLVP